MAFLDLQEGILEEFSGAQAAWSQHIQDKIESYRSWKSAGEAESKREKYATDTAYREKRKTSAKDSFRKRYAEDPVFRAKHYAAKKARRAQQKAQGLKRTS